MATSTLVPPLILRSFGVKRASQAVRVRFLPVFRGAFDVLSSVTTHLLNYPGIQAEGGSFDRQTKTGIFPTSITDPLLTNWTHQQLVPAEVRGFPRYWPTTMHTA